MKASYNWLKECCDFQMQAHGLAEKLGNVGLNVETFEPVGADWRLDVEVTSNRPDCLSHLGLAREIAALTGTSAKRPPLGPDAGGEQSFDDLSSVEVAAPDLCPHYTARLIRGVRIRESPEWMRNRLEVCGIHPINNVVDITNYVMLECGQPLHAFDFHLLEGGRIVVRRSRPGEIIVTIDGGEHELTGKECVIADASRPVALAGVMGGAQSEIRHNTTDVLLEAARFEPTNIRRTSRRHLLASESSYRFERGIDPEITDWASRRACQLIAELAGGAVVAGVGAVRADETLTPELTLRLARLAMLLGIEVPREVTLRIFRGLGLEALGESADGIILRVPSWRGDLRREVDLIEEVARIYGYDKIKETTEMPVRPTAPAKEERVGRRARRLISGAGFNEVLTRSLIRPTPVQLAQPWHAGQPLQVRNPTTSERTHLRLTCMANLLRIKRFNQMHGNKRVDIYEIGAVYLPREDEKLPHEKECLTLLTDRDEGLRALKGILANLMDELGVEGDLRETPESIGPFQAGEALALHLGDDLLGCVGTLDAEIARDYDLAGRPALMELDFDLLARRAQLVRPARAVPPYPATSRDLAIVVAEDVLWADVEACVLASADETLESIEPFDVYRGDPIPAGHKSIAFSLTFRRADATLTSEEAEQARQTILDALRDELNAELR
ncbi:MAG: phenylalanine--tRNA ligase subunit beta [Planctomycetes bacterium]|nr:phenylalanine--tRNA ligase subunit beta [Planctomycetota bacterium]